MGRRSLKLAWVPVGLRLAMGGLCVAQERPPSIPEPPPVEAAVERLPEYQVEVLVFAYHAFDPTEEQFGHEPRNPLLDFPAPPHRPDGPYRPEAPDQADAPGQANALDQPDALRQPDRLDEPLPRDEPSIAERYIDALLDLEEAADPVPQAPGIAAPGAAPAAAERGDTGAATGVGHLGPASTEATVSEADTPAEAPFAYRILTREELQLVNAYATLERLDAYTPWVHGGWAQQGLPEERAQPFHLSRLGAFNPAGTIQLHLSRFLHVTVDLSYQAPQWPEPEPSGLPDEGPRRYGAPAHGLEEIKLPPRYRLRIQRRTRSGELHYFDHPAFGVLVVVRPQPEELDEADDTVGPAA